MRSRWCGCRATASAGRTSSPAASCSASPSPARWSSARRCCCSTSRCPTSMPACGSTCAARSATCSRRLKITTVYVTHDQEEALAVSDRIAVMQAGRIEQLGGPVDIYRKPANLFVAQFMGTTNVLTGIGGPGRARPCTCGSAPPMCSFRNRCARRRSRELVPETGGPAHRARRRGRLSEGRAHRSDHKEGRVHRRARAAGGGACGRHAAQVAVLDDRARALPGSAHRVGATTRPA